jgi:hypothetical protein
MNRRKHILRDFLVQGSGFTPPASGAHVSTDSTCDNVPPSLNENTESPIAEYRFSVPVEQVQLSTLAEGTTHNIWNKARVLVTTPNSVVVLPIMVKNEQNRTNWYKSTKFGTEILYCMPIHFRTGAN